MNFHQALGVMLADVSKRVRRKAWPENESLRYHGPFEFDALDALGIERSPHAVSCIAMCYGFSSHSYEQYVPSDEDRRATDWEQMHSW
jgi:hypothetical protein